MPRATRVGSRRPRAVFRGWLVRGRVTVCRALPKLTPPLGGKMVQYRTGASASGDPKGSVAARLRVECGGVEAQIIGNVFDPVLGFVLAGKHVPDWVKALFNKCFMYCFNIRQPHVISPYIQPDI